MFHQWFVPETGATGILEVWDGSYWNQVAQFTDSTDNVEYQMINVSSHIGGISDAKVRFKWSGNSTGWWATDNFKVYAPLALDAALESISSPKMPFTAGSKDVKVDISNLGINTITTLTINWEINGVLQTPYSWTGNLPLGDLVKDVTIGSHTFTDGEKVNLRVWLSNPNGQTDMNDQNNELQTNIYGSLCGEYTIGGTNPDFVDFTEAVTVLNHAGISCPVVFKVRDGVYDEQISITKINGVDSINTITFEGESGDSSLVVLQYNDNNNVLDYTVSLSGSEHISFKYLSIKRGNNNYVIRINNTSHHITFSHCYIKHEFSNRTAVQSNYCDTLILENNYIYGSNELTNLKYLYYNSNEIIGSSSNLFIYSSSDIIINNNTTEGTVQIYNSEEGNIESNIINREIYAENLGVFVISNNILNGSSSYINAFNSSDIFIVNNSLRGYINLASFSGSGSKIIDNTIASSGYEYGINTQGAMVSEVSGNTITGIENNTGITINSSNTLVSNNFVQTQGLGSTSGIVVGSNGSNSKIVFNSINNLGTDPTAARAIQINGGTNLTVKNNIFSCPGGGYPAFIATSLTGHDWDYNDYYSSTGKIGNYGGVDYTVLSEWGPAIGGDANSKSVNPFYISDTDLSMNHIQLNNTASLISGIDTDIDSTNRNATSPDMGAREYTPCNNDAGINKIISPTSPLESNLMSVVVELQNQGNTSLTSVEINWEVNGVIQTPYAWTGNLASAAYDTVSLPAYAFTGANIFDIKVWTSNPNGFTDCNFYNDTSYVDNLVSSLCGEYTIGGLNPDFVDFTEAVTVLNHAGISCPVVFKVRDGVYDEQISITKINGVDSINTITFEGESGDSSLVVLQYNDNNNVLDYTVSLSGSEHISFKYLSIKRGNNNYVIRINNTSHHITFSHCYIKHEFSNRTAVQSNYCDTLILENNYIYGSNELTNLKYLYYNSNEIIGSSSNLFIYSSSDIIINNNTTEGTVQIYNSEEGNIESNIINREIYAENLGVFVISNNILNGSSSYINAFNSSDIFIVNNSLRGYINLASFSGSGSKIIDNTIASSGYEYGINTQGAMVSEVSGNTITGIENNTGININSSNTLVSNNFIQTQGLGSTSGIVVGGNGSNSKIVFNSVNNLGTDPTAARAIQINGGTNLTIKNNIFSCPGGGYPAFIATSLTGHDWDYNDYYSSTGKIGYYNGTDYTVLNEWGAAIGGDANSIDKEPFYESDTELRPYQRYINGAGVPAANVLVDIDGEIRNDAAPDIGADEFIADFGITRLISPTLECDLTSTEPVIVNIRQFGDIPFQDLKVAYQINGGTIQYDTIPGSLNNDIEHAFPATVDLSTDGVYSFKIWLVSANDDNVQNDTLRVERYKKPSPTVDFSFVTACAHQNIEFTGIASIVQGTIDRYEWNFGDTVTSELQNPMHIYELSDTYSVNF
ncbi:MAG TPA: right-handed parallel beta-helix repeat-containing protein, partial [Bacteroidales bacterium]|nr:right-handed parallel beta-helix repeat-containing protein [Bacteroidales bacterium]